MRALLLYAASSVGGSPCTDAATHEFSRDNSADIFGENSINMHVAIADSHEIVVMSSRGVEPGQLLLNVPSRDFIQAPPHKFRHDRVREG